MFDVVEVREEGKKINFVCGYNAAYATAQDLRDGHSSNGYSLEVFSSREEAEEYYAKYYPNESLNFKGIRRILSAVRADEILSISPCGILPHNPDHMKKIRRRVEDALRKLPERAFSDLYFIAEYLGVDLSE